MTLLVLGGPLEGHLQSLYPQIGLKDLQCLGLDELGIGIDLHQGTLRSVFVEIPWLTCFIEEHEEEQVG